MKAPKILLTVILISILGFMNSCKDDNDNSNNNEETPTVNVGTFSSIKVNGTSVSDNSGTSVSGSYFTLNWAVSKGDYDIKSIKIELGSAVVTDSTGVVWNGTSSGSLATSTQTSLWTNTIKLAATTGTYKITLTDANNNTKTYTITVTATGTPLTTSNFTLTSNSWVLDAVTQTFLTKVGWKWLTNGTNGSMNYEYFSFQTLSSSRKIVSLSVSDYNNITTKEALKTKIDASSSVVTYDLPTSLQMTYSDKVVGAINGSNYYLIKFKTCTISPSLSNDTYDSITGEIKE
jgi:hypothetical protein